MNVRSHLKVRLRRLLLASGLFLATACGNGKTTTGGDATVGPSNNCAASSGSLGADRAGVFAAALGSNSQQLKSGDTVAVATATNDIVLSNIAGGVSALEIAINSATLDYTLPAGGTDGTLPAFECEVDDGTGAAGAANWVPCKTEAWPTLIPNDASFDETCASAKHATKQTIRILYHKPPDNGSRTATLTINHIDTVTQAGSAPKITPFVVKLVAKVGNPTIKLDPATDVNFGTVPLNQDATRTVTISNLGDGDLTISAITLAKVAPKFFSLTTDTGEKFDGSASAIALPTPWTLTPGGAKTLTVIFHGLDTVGHGANLTFSSNDAHNAEATLTMEANQKVACITILPNPLLNWGGVLVGQASVKTVKLTNCGSELLTLNNFALANDPDAAFLLDPTTILLGQAPAGPAPLTLQINQSVTVPITCTPPAAQTAPFTANLTFTDNTLTPQKSVALQCTGVTTSCATPLISCVEGEEVPPQSVIHLDATGSLAPPGKTLTYKWTVKSQPPGAVGYTFSPSDTASKVSFGTSTNTANGPQIQLNVVGAYTFELTVKDSDGKDGCGPNDFTVLVKPDAGVHVELLWDTPQDTDKTDDSGSDLDLHFAHPDAEKANICTNPLTLCAGKPCACQMDGDGDGVPDPWFNNPFDCYWFNPQPFWGDPQLPDDDPFLALDDTNGWGPENLNMAAPENVQYRIGVHYWDAHDYGDSTATINVYIDGALIGTFVQLMHECDLWWVKRLDYANKALTDFPNAGANGKVTPAYKAEQFAGLSAKCQ